MASFLHATDLHFGRPDNSLGIGKSWNELRKSGATPIARSLRTMMATHDRDVVAALTDLIVELGSELDAVLLTGDIATTSASSALGEACRWLKNTSKLAGDIRTIVLPGNHDRFGRFPTYLPGATAFDARMRNVPNVESPAPAHGVRVVALDETCLLACVDLTLKSCGEATGWSARLSQGIVREPSNVTSAIAAARTSRTSHVVVATHFPLDPPDARMATHECINGVALREELLSLSKSLPVLLLSGHLHREAHYREGNLFIVVGATASQALHPAIAPTARPANLAEAGAHAVFTVRTDMSGFVVTRWRYGDDPALDQTPPAKRFCTPTALTF